MDDTKFIKLVYVIFGSWQSVVGHTLLFAFILFVKQDLLFFTTLVSIEAIYIGIFILMAANREENLKSLKDESNRKYDRALVRKDVNITENVKSELDQVKEDLEKILQKF